MGLPFKKGGGMGPSFWQILIIVVVVLFIFGPKRIPGLGKSLGEAIKGFRKGIKEDDKEESAEDQKTLSKKEESVDKNDS